jgi:hypothetical protein
MTVQVTIPTQRTTREVSQAEQAEQAPVFVGPWDTHSDNLGQEPTTAPAEIQVEQPQTDRRGIRQALAARYAVYRLNRRFRRNQREFDRAMDHLAHDPSGQQELQMSWTLRD